MGSKIIAVLVLGFLFYECGSPSNAEEQSAGSIKNSIPATEVSVSTASVKPFEYLISTSGIIASASEVRAEFKRAGIIEKVFVSNGKAAKQGQLLAILSKEQQELSFSKARLQLQEKKLAYTDMMLSYERMKDSVRYANISSNIRISSGLAAAEIAYSEAKLEYENSFVKAQIGGMVSGMEANPGSPVSPGELFCYVHDPVHLVVEAEVLEADALLVSKGVKAEIRPLASAGEFYQAQVENVDPRVDSKTGLVKIVVKLSGKPNVFPGMHVQTTLRLPYEKNIIIPQEAVVIRSGKAVVFTVQEGLAKWNYVKVGRENGVEVEILEGLKKGDNVIITNNLQLAHDAPVSIVKN
ncbi:MAG: efflux RND transporter periplasmic adaptor subunit [Cyclobacteriaceae bacterium]